MVTGVSVAWGRGGFGSQTVGRGIMRRAGEWKGEAKSQAG